jgi:hypothetical protein
VLTFEILTIDVQTSVSDSKSCPVLIWTSALVEVRVREGVGRVRVQMQEVRWVLMRAQEAVGWVW